MKASKEDFKTLKDILKNIQNPEKLDNHPWTQKLVVKDLAARNNSVANGTQLILSLGELFKKLQPPTPPQPGKRLDTRWGRFGILAANYFAPLAFGRVYPRTLRDAWWRIDESILLFVFGENRTENSAEEQLGYQLLGEEAEFIANSTISDWHRQGIQNLADFFLATEENLRISAEKENKKEEKLMQEKTKKWRWVALALASIILVVLFFITSSLWRVYNAALEVKEDISTLESLDIKKLKLEPDSIESVGDSLHDLTEDIAILQKEILPWLAITNKMGWIPVYGGDIQYADELLLMAEELTQAAELSYNVGFDFLTLIRDDSRNVEAYDMTKLLLEKEADLLLAKTSADKAINIRQSIETTKLSPQTSALIEKLDQYLPLMDNALSLSLTLPDLLGATNTGPKTYLVLIQNEDELRPTGGFLTSVANVVIRNGELVNLDIRDSYAIDDEEQLYPASPWQLDYFMNLPAMTFRDTNWYTDYPTTVVWAEYLYAKTNSHSVDGVIAIDQHVLAQLLTVTGRIFIPNIGQSISSENIIEVMRAQKIPPSAEERDPSWHRKQFMRPISSAILEKFLEGDEIRWEDLIKIMLKELDEHHILVQLDNPVLSELLASRGWDGALRHETGDFLMIVDSNVGYNKTNAVVSRSLIYDVDLTDITSPTSYLTVVHQNDAKGENGENGKCVQRQEDPDHPWYAINRCYYNYLRVYVPAETILTGASPHAVTRDEMIFLYDNVPARVDLLNEEIENIQAYGTLFAVPIGESLQTGFQFSLPAEIIQETGQFNEKIYKLTIQKQSGITSVPVTLRLHLPTGAKVISVSTEGIIDENNLLFELELREDIEFELIFKP